ncbi:MAG: mechanosensitive ion channel family protein [bacterium]
MTAFFDNVAQFFTSLDEILAHEIFAAGNFRITWLALFATVITILVAVIISRLIRNGLARFSGENHSMDEATAYNLSRIAHYVLLTLALLISLTYFGIDLSNLAIVAGALGVGIGFGLQSIANNFISGIIMLFERNMNVGDVVQLPSGVSGVVKEINVRSTLIRTFDNLDILVPNSEFTSNQVTNWTLHEREFRIRVPFGVAYGTDKELVKKAAIEAASRVPLTISPPGREPLVWLVGFGDSSLDFQLVVWVNPRTNKQPGGLIPQYLWEIETSLVEHGIEIPFPQRDLHIRSGLPQAETDNAD